MSIKRLLSTYILSVSCFLFVNEPEVLCLERSEGSPSTVGSVIMNSEEVHAGGIETLTAEFEQGRFDQVLPVPVYHIKELDNGATIVASYLPDSRLVTIQVRVLSGLSNEGEYAGTGISHYLEHMIFRGLTDDGESLARKSVKALGGSINGSTGQDSAEYHITVPLENMEPAMDLIVGMVMGPVFDEKELALERDVILKEMNMINDNPGGRNLRLLFQKAFTHHVYRHPIIGYRDLFLELEKEDLEKYHRAAYAPQRVILGVAGGVEPEKVFDYASQVLGGYSRGMELETCLRQEPRQTAPKMESFGMDVELGYLAIGFHSVSIHSSDLYATNVLAHVLGSGSDSLLYRKLVREKELLHSVSAFNMTPSDPGLFVVAGRGEPGDMDEARDAIFEVIEQMIINGVTEKNLERARNSLLFSYLSSHQGTHSVVSSMTSSTAYTGGPSFMQTYVEGVEIVTPEDVIRVASKYLNERSSTTVYILPDQYLEKAHEREYQRFHVSDAADDIKMRTLDNGIRLMARRKGSLPLVSVIFSSTGGLMAEDIQNNGISNLMASLLLKGTDNRTQDEIVPAIEHLGGNISASSGFNTVGLSMSLLSRDLNVGMKIFSDVLMNPVFPAEELEKERWKVLAGIRASKQNIFSEARTKMNALLYGDHPYSMRVSGEIDTVETLDRESIKQFYKENILPGNSVLTVVGDIDPVEALDILSEHFSSWQSDHSPIVRDDLPGEIKRKEAELAMKREQSVVTLAFPGVTIDDERKYALDVAAIILSGRDGILFDIIRDEAGLAYTSGASNSPQPYGGQFTFYSATTAEYIDEAEEKLFEAINMILSGAFSDADFEASKVKAMADYARSMEGNTSVATALTLGELLGVGALHYLEYPSAIEAVTREDVINAAKEILNPDLAVVVKVRSDSGS